MLKLLLTHFREQFEVATRRIDQGRELLCTGTVRLVNREGVEVESGVLLGGAFMGDGSSAMAEEGVTTLERLYAMSTEGTLEVQFFVMTPVKEKTSVVKVKFKYPVIDVGTALTNRLAKRYLIDQNSLEVAQTNLKNTEKNFWDAAEIASHAGFGYVYITPPIDKEKE